MSSPSVSAILHTTYLYPDRLAESVGAFLAQSYEGPKELIILNSNPKVKLLCESKVVRVVNLPSKLPTVGDHWNLLLDLAHPSLIVFPWDENDISLPHRITQGVNKLYSIRGLKVDYFDPHYMFIEKDGKLTKPSEELACTHKAGGFAREKLRYSPIDEDVYLDMDTRAKITVRVYENGIGDKASNWTYIEREPILPVEIIIEGTHIIEPDKVVIKKYINKHKTATEAFTGKRT